jgi:hypothetical protein
VKKYLNDAERQTRKAERRAALRVIIEKIASMSDAERQALASKMTARRLDGQSYSPRNQMLIALQLGTDCTLLGGFRQWLSQGRCVMKDQHGATILFPVQPNDGKKGRVFEATDAATESAARAARSRMKQPEGRPI